ncbi:EAL domain-containing protein [Oceanospirillum sediminis]|uniref:Bifunctional diguanylate cyclase/phosphodiesterase n=1 Tax=Oceanospirillum sediminis TaxID=2760088 RepID=A0A839IVS5_9GAMM|nr:bifunctional diguanylate cyclase/phosphodiesterase [Oceanospirillum sediminis]MBB1488852.1 bifunctional diguanylate cyclase/phosphodiesterase [Oceanospirillum sediminis]
MDICSLTFDTPATAKEAIQPDVSRMLWLHTGSEFSMELSQKIRELYKELCDYTLAVALHDNYCNQNHEWLLTKEEELPGYPIQQVLLPQQIDPITGLRNQNYFHKYIREYIQLSSDDFYLIISDIDQFRAVSHFYGTEAEQYALTRVAEHLQQYMENSEVFRLSGDQFLILMPAHYFTDIKLETALEQLSRIELNWNNYQINISMSFGIVRHDSDSLTEKDISGLLSNTNMALNQAKRLKKSTFIFSGEPHLKLEYGQYLRGVGLLSDALKQDTLEAFYQPIICNKTHRLLSHECLARIRHKYGWIGADQFIPQASQFRLQGKLTLRILEKARKTMQKYPGRFSINLAPEDLFDDQILSAIIKLLNEQQLGKRVTIELVETSSLINLSRSIQSIEKLRATGCKLAIDDFGSGFANFSYIYRLKPDYLKLDGSLIRDLDRNPELRTIVKGIISIASELKIETVAEFVHNESVYYWVKKLGVDASQGFYLFPPQEIPHQPD